MLMEMVSQMSDRRRHFGAVFIVYSFLHISFMCSSLCLSMLSRGTWKIFVFSGKSIFTCKPLDMVPVYFFHLFSSFSFWCVTGIQNLWDSKWKNRVCHRLSWSFRPIKCFEVFIRLDFSLVHLASLSVCHENDNNNRKVI